MSAGFRSCAGVTLTAGFDADGVVETVGAGVTAVPVLGVLGSGSSASAVWLPDAGGL
ncbi:hypothetical protein [Prosthecobacter sp.]|uniref:hypothetical protein n=1 Tax=Prosthecobacter sp. TaxID=1965333 RepID=UPI0037C67E10